MTTTQFMREHESTDQTTEYETKYIFTHSLKYSTDFRFIFVAYRFLLLLIFSIALKIFLSFVFTVFFCIEFSECVH